MDQAEPLYDLAAFDLRSAAGLTALARSAGGKLVRRFRSR
jgi:hypothetical protein